MPTQTTEPLGYGTYLGTAAAVLAAAGTVIAAIQENDFATAAAGAATVVAIFETLNGRFSQAVARIRTGIDKAAPVIDDIQARAAEKKPTV
jgi:hypothetical protein